TGGRVRRLELVGFCLHEPNFAVVSAAGSERGTSMSFDARGYPLSANSPSIGTLIEDLEDDQLEAIDPERAHIEAGIAASGKVGDQPACHRPQGQADMAMSIAEESI